MVSPQPLNFSAIDFETASAKRASVCQVGLTHVRDGRVETTESWYVIPPTGLDDFQPMNVAIHGITAEHVVQGGGLEWEDSLSRILASCNGVPLVAHNATFDKSVFDAACGAASLAIPNLTWLDTLSLARREFPELPNHTLPIVAEHVGADLTKHHDAAADSTAAALIVLAAAARKPASELSALFGAEPQKTSSQRFDPRFTTDRGYTRKVSELPTPNSKADPEGPLFGQHVVLTGSLEGMTRGDAMDEMAARGAQVQNGVTKKTTMLVLAEWDTVPTNYDPALGSSKERKAGEYNVKGQGIRFVGRKEFESWLSRPAEPSARAVLGRRIGAAMHRNQDLQVRQGDVSSLQKREPSCPNVDRPRKSSAHEPAPSVLSAPQDHASTAQRSASSPPPLQTSDPGETVVMERFQTRSGNSSHAGGSGAAASHQIQQEKRSGGGLGGSLLFILGIAMTALNGIGLLAFLIPLIYGAAQQDGQLAFGSLLFVAFFTVFLGLGVLLIVLGARVRRRRSHSGGEGTRNLPL